MLAVQLHCQPPPAPSLLSKPGRQARYGNHNPFLACGGTVGAFQLRKFFTPWQHLHGSNKSVAASGKSLDILGTLRAILQSHPDFVEREIDSLLKVDIGAVGPHVISNLLPGNQFAGLTDKQAKDLARLGRQDNHRAIFAQFTSFEIKLEISKRQQRYPLYPRTICECPAVGLARVSAI
jgi:hypothetical protein